MSVARIKENEDEKRFHFCAFGETSIFGVNGVKLARKEIFFQLSLEKSFYECEYDGENEMRNDYKKF